jgi:seryl-tRNA synthetase
VFRNAHACCYSQPVNSGAERSNSSGGRKGQPSFVARAKPLQSEQRPLERENERLSRENESLRQELIQRDRKLSEAEKHFAEAEKQVADFERKLALRLQNSVTSSKPPSSDGLAGEQRPRGRKRVRVSVSGWASLVAAGTRVCRAKPIVSD